MHYRLTIHPSEHYEGWSPVTVEFEKSTDELAIEVSEKSGMKFVMPDEKKCDAVPILLESWGQYEDRPTIIKRWQ